MGALHGFIHSFSFIAQLMSFVPSNGDTMIIIVVVILKPVIFINFCLFSDLFLDSHKTPCNHNIHFFLIMSHTFNQERRQDKGEDKKEKKERMVCYMHARCNNSACIHAYSSNICCRCYQFSFFFKLSHHHHHITHTDCTYSFQEQKASHFHHRHDHHHSQDLPTLSFHFKQFPFLLLYNLIVLFQKREVGLLESPIFFFHTLSSSAPFILFVICSNLFLSLCLFFLSASLVYHKSQDRNFHAK